MTLTLLERGFFRLRCSVLIIGQSRGTSELAQGELLRFLAEAVWYPTALLPSQGVRWQAVTDNSARASLQDANTSVSLLFHFAENGLIESVRAESRGEWSPAR